MTRIELSTVPSVDEKAPFFDGNTTVQTRTAVSIDGTLVSRKFEITYINSVIKRDFRCELNSKCQLEAEPKENYIKQVRQHMERCARIFNKAVRELLAHEIIVKEEMTINDRTLKVAQIGTEFARKVRARLVEEAPNQIFKTPFTDFELNIVLTVTPEEGAALRAKALAMREEKEKAAAQ